MPENFVNPWIELSWRKFHNTHELNWIGIFFKDTWLIWVEFRKNVWWLRVELSQFLSTAELPSSGTIATSMMAILWRDLRHLESDNNRLRFEIIICMDICCTTKKIKSINISYNASFVPIGVFIVNTIRSRKMKRI